MSFRTLPDLDHTKIGHAESAINVIIGEVFSEPHCVYLCRHNESCEGSVDETTEAMPGDGRYSAHVN